MLVVSVRDVPHHNCAALVFSSGDLIQIHLVVLFSISILICTSLLFHAQGGILYLVELLLLLLLLLLEELFNGLLVLVILLLEIAGWSLIEHIGLLLELPKGI